MGNLVPYNHLFPDEAVISACPFSIAHTGSVKAGERYNQACPFLIITVDNIPWYPFTIFKPVLDKNNTSPKITLYE
jgi:hypothetical protein